eukprot:gene7475-8746_t
MYALRRHINLYPKHLDLDTICIESFRDCMVADRGKKYNCSTLSDIIPLSTVELTFTELFSYDIPTTGFIPDTVKRIRFTNLYNGATVGSLPSQLVFLSFGERYNRPLGFPTPLCSLKHLTLGQDFDQDFECLPASLQYLSLAGDWFNRSLPFAEGLETLVLGQAFKLPLVPGSMPSLKSLSLHHTYNEKLPECLKITHLSIGCDYEHMIPQTVSNLILLESSNNQVRLQIPMSVTNLELGSNFVQPLDQLSIVNSQVVHLKFGTKWNHPLEPNTLPDSLTHLTFGACFNTPLQLGSIPTSVSHLDLGTQYNHKLKTGCIPNSVVHLKLSDCYNQSLSIPNSVKNLIFGSAFNQPLKLGLIPRGVTSVTFGEQFNQDLPKGSLPSSILTLRFGDRFDQEISASNLPNNIETLEFGHHFDQAIPSLPQSVKNLTFGDLDQSIPGGIPQTVTSLYLYYCLEELTSEILTASVSKFSVGEFFDQSIPLRLLLKNKCLLILNDNLQGGFIQITPQTLELDLRDVIKRVKPRTSPHQ